LALWLKQRLVPRAGPAEQERWRTRLEAVRDPFALRVSGRQRVAASVGYWLRTWAGSIGRKIVANFQRLRNGLLHKGVRGLVHALWKRSAWGSWESPTPNST